MRIKAALLCVALAAAPLQAQETAATTADARAVIAAVLAHQASIRGPESGAETCVQVALAGPPVAPGTAADEDPLQPDHSVRIYFQWHVPDAPPPVRALPPPPDPSQNGRRNRQRAAPPPPPPAALDQATAEHLNALRTQAARTPAAPALAEIDAPLITPPLRLQRPNDDCATLTFSTPAFAGDAAFVEFAYACGTVCGNGGLYALQRRDGRWMPVGIADIWIR
ncbi:MAG: hypothetical protein JO276_10790 [Sphingomonadaceae bacterium]|nr:hypothetical protein [Sphingomonadaceae bacterium]